MNHGYCGILNPQSPCMDKGRCTKQYPKQFQEVTSIQNDGYPIYRRRNDGKFFTNHRGDRFDNTHIVPYNLTLATEFDCHINVEICSSIKAIKYIYKYILKGINNIFFKTRLKINLINKQVLIELKFIFKINPSKIINKMKLNNLLMEGTFQRVNQLGERLNSQFKAMVQ